jgi:hypothetical protein
MSSPQKSVFSFDEIPSTVATPIAMGIIMSSLFVRIEGWPRRNVDPNDNGIEVQIYLARDPNVRSTVLAGVISVDHEMAPAGVTITENPSSISEPEGCSLLRLACDTVWNAIMVEQAAAASTKWQFLADWLGGHRDRAEALRLEMAANRSMFP